ncbi:MAG: glycosyltransferase family 4 protein [Bdellovibrionales bacterium]|jgi:mannosylglucosylglycerate synthase|nr:glycosyltransferase family 4 protein [Bdellovibrionales bacterium]MBT3525439.1 glycosyltransferase family 4 protein [Bdellovibrionales bacterium]MBT7669810.1 glycosyltransferase family 4 protein [Bdellovibrionales bacterium]MBT7767048.1 glycosyltransferase family 4 protein [Bdellovibrionales bacterium]
MRIGIIIGRIGDVDGVALETEKWIKVLRRMGHDIYILSGRFRDHVVGPERETLLSTLSFFSPECEWEQNRAFFYPNPDPGELTFHLEKASVRVARRIFRWVLQNKIQMIISENASALPCHLSMGLGIKKALEIMDIPVITHDHDFYWERGDRYKTPHKSIQKMITESFPLRLPHVKHAVINSYSQNAMKERFGRDSMVIPNVMDFSEPYGVKDSYNRDLLKELKFEKDAIPLFQITRIVKRKGIEVAIELVHRLQDQRFKLVITGSFADDERKGYYLELKNYIRQHRLGKQVIFGHKRILSERGLTYHKKKIYSLSDAYANAAACTYFSTYEGFGNAFVECVLAKKPIFVNNYKPVYWPDIGSLGFKTVQLEDNQLTDAAVSEISDILGKPKLQKEVVEHNYQLGKQYFSLDVLEEKLEQLIGSF